MKVGELVAELTLDTSGMSKGVDKAGKEAKRLEADLASINKGGLVAAGALTAMGVAAMEAANRAGEYADQIKEVSSITGMSTDQVQRWKYAADQTGVSFDALTVTMRMLTQNIQNVDDKNSTLKASLDAIGVSAKTASGGFKDTNTIMLETLTALKNMDDPIKRNTIAMQLYGRSWSELADFMERDVDLAAIMAQADPISKYKLDQAEAYKNKMNALGASLDQVVVKIGTKLIPAFTALTAAFTAYGVPAVNSFIDTVNIGIDNMVYRMLQAMDLLNSLSGGRLGSGSAAAAWDKYKADSVREENAANSGSYSASSPDMSTGMSGGGSSVFGDSGSSSSGSGSGSTPQLNTGTNLSSSSASAAMAAIARGVATGNPSLIAWGASQMKKVVAGNPYANNDSVTSTFSGADAISSSGQAAVRSMSTITPSKVPVTDPFYSSEHGGWVVKMSDGSYQWSSDPSLTSASDQAAASARYSMVMGNVMAVTGLSEAEISARGGLTGNVAQTYMENRGATSGYSGTVEAPTVSEYGGSSVSYTSSGAIKSNYQMGITQNGNGTLTVNLTLDGKVIAQSVVENLSSLGVKV